MNLAFNTTDGVSIGKLAMTMSAMACPRARASRSRSRSDARARCRFLASGVGRRSGIESVELRDDLQNFGKSRENDAETTCRFAAGAARLLRSGSQAHPALRAAQCRTDSPEPQ
jgi:hypothetical protein